MSTENTRQEIEEILRREFAPTVLDVIDDTYAHRGHAAAMGQPSAGHFKVRMVSKLFRATKQVARHRMVYEKLGGLMTDKIHALSLNLSADDETQ